MCGRERVASTGAPDLGDVVAAVTPVLASRPWRNNNPGDLRCLSGSQKWDGQVGVDNGPGGPFAIFTNRTMGWRALAVCLLTYFEQHCLDTVDAICDRWAPPSDGNDTSAYTALVAAKVGVTRFEMVDLRDEATLTGLCAAIALAEGGARLPWIEDERTAGIRLALGVTT